MTLSKAVAGVTRIIREEVVAAVEPKHQGTNHSGFAPNEAADVVAETAVPLMPERARKFGSQLIGPSGIPGLGDQPDMAQDRVGADRGQERIVGTGERAVGVADASDPLLHVCFVSVGVCCQAVELAPRNVRIDRFDVLAIRHHDGLVDVDVEVDCSSGTYIRALARDIGATLGVGGHLTALRRTRVGRFGLDQARTLDDLAEQPRLSYSLDEACLQSFPRRDLSPAEAEDTGHGRPLKPAGIEGVYAATAPDGRVVALLTDGATRTKPVVVLRPATLDSV